jgi:hypothetical protein
MRLRPSVLYFIFFLFSGHRPLVDAGLGVSMNWNEQTEILIWLALASGKEARSPSRARLINSKTYISTRHHMRRILDVISTIFPFCCTKTI